ncbi:MAG: Na/Pi cotransporter family protein, partial [Clostridia bacterium]
MNNETVQMIITLLGGLALFIFGMNFMSDGLQRSAGDKMRSILAMLTRNPVLGAV